MRSWCRRPRRARLRIRIWGCKEVPMGQWKVSSNSTHERAAPIGVARIFGFSLAVFLMFAVAGCGKSYQSRTVSALEQFKQRESVEFLYVTPDAPVPVEVDSGSGAEDDSISQRRAAETHVAGHRILGATTMIRAQQDRWISGLQQMVAAGSPEHRLGCFNPVYALRDPKSPEDYILICFECSAIQCSGVARPLLVPIDQSAAPGLADEIAAMAPAFDAPPEPSVPTP